MKQIVITEELIIFTEGSKYLKNKNKIKHEKVYTMG